MLKKENEKYKKSQQNAQNYLNSKTSGMRNYNYSNGSSTRNTSAVKSVKVGDGKLINGEKYDNNFLTNTLGVFKDAGNKLTDSIRNQLNTKFGGLGYGVNPSNNNNVDNNIYGDVEGTRVTQEIPGQSTTIEYDAEHNLVMQPITIVDEGAGRWGEEIALEIEFDHLDTPPTTNPPSNPPTTNPPANPPTTRDTQLRLPIGGTVWEDTIKDNKKHTGYNNLLDKGNEKGIPGVRVRIHRNFVELNANNSIKRLINKEVARVYRRDTGELVDITKNPIITDENGQWGGFDIHDVGFNTQELSQMGGVANSKNYAILFDVTFDYDGIMYEPVMPLQTQDNNIDENGKKVNTEVFKDGQSIYNTTTTEEKKK